MSLLTTQPLITAIIPAAGIGRRMASVVPKQYLPLAGKTMLEITVDKLLSIEQLSEVIIALSADDHYFQKTALVNTPKVRTVIGGKERVDSVLAALNSFSSVGEHWALVHDAARPCVTAKDIERLITHCLTERSGGLLAAPAKDTMKRTFDGQTVALTENREQLWHALTPQMYPAKQLKHAIESAQKAGVIITDESSAIEYCQYSSLLVQGQADNIKVTSPEDLALAEYILQQQRS
jgi:2-C-methyl-D-erythritol 4-phosphate cytidylyltransferase